MTIAAHHLQRHARAVTHTLGHCLHPKRRITRESSNVVGHKCDSPLFPIANLRIASRATWCYRRHFRIETFFSDQKSRGFQIHKSCLSDPVRLSRSLIAACLAYVWMLSLGLLTGVFKFWGKSKLSDCKTAPGACAYAYVQAWATREMPPRYAPPNANTRC